MSPRSAKLASFIRLVAFYLIDQGLLISTRTCITEGFLRKMFSMSHGFFTLDRARHPLKMTSRLIVFRSKQLNRNCKQINHKREDGYTLIELLVVLSIISLIVGLVGPRVLNYLSNSKVKAAHIQIESLVGALDLYYLDNGAYPTSGAGLTALLRKPEDSSNWNGPYLKGATIPNDPWGKPYEYVSPGKYGPYEITSFGSDGKEGGTDTAADISNRQK